jgi:heme-degrading monooxygenase HmoA
MTIPTSSLTTARAAWRGVRRATIEGGVVIVRMWRGWVETDQAQAYADYIEGTGIAEYRKTPGNSGAQLLWRDLGDGRTEIVTLSWWSDLDDIRAFAGDEIDVAKFYPEDDEYLVDRELTASHFVVNSSDD